VHPAVGQRLEETDQIACSSRHRGGPRAKGQGQKMLPRAGTQLPPPSMATGTNFKWNQGPARQVSGELRVYSLGSCVAGRRRHKGGAPLSTWGHRPSLREDPSLAVVGVNLAEFYLIGQIQQGKHQVVPRQPRLRRGEDAAASARDSRSATIWDWPWPQFHSPEPLLFLLSRMIPGMTGEWADAD
jgi:hypothetical protein